MLAYRDELSATEFINQNSPQTQATPLVHDVECNTSIMQSFSTPAAVSLITVDTGPRRME